MMLLVALIIQDCFNSHVLPIHRCYPPKNSCLSYTLCTFSDLTLCHWYFVNYQTTICLSTYSADAYTDTNETIKFVCLPCFGFGAFTEVILCVHPLLSLSPLPPPPNSTFICSVVHILIHCLIHTLLVCVCAPVCSSYDLLVLTLVQCAYHMPGGKV